MQELSARRKLDPCEHYEGESTLCIFDK